MNLTENSFTSLRAPDTYVIVKTFCEDYIVKKNGAVLTKKDSTALRYFNSRNSARKRIARERSGDFHR
jgi:hypothetical protein